MARRFWVQGPWTDFVPSFKAPPADSWLPQTNQPYLTRTYDRTGWYMVDPKVVTGPGIPQLPSYGPGTEQPRMDLRRLQYLYPSTGFSNVAPIPLPEDAYTPQPPQPYLTRRYDRQGIFIIDPVQLTKPAFPLVEAWQPPPLVYKHKDLRYMYQSVFIDANFGVAPAGITPSCLALRDAAVVMCVVSNQPVTAETLTTSGVVRTVLDNEC